MPITKLIIVVCFILLSLLAFFCICRAIYKFLVLMKNIKSKMVDFVPLLVFFPATYEQSARKDYNSFINNLFVAFLAVLGAFIIKYYFF